jgi:hypothetical protein
MIVFGMTFGICVVLGLVFQSCFPTEAWKGSLPTVAQDDHYLVLEAYNDQAFDLYQLYYGIGNSMQSAQKADVLILGNSKPFFAFRNEAVKTFTQKTGIKIFNLAGSYGDNLALAKAFIKKYHLSPKILVINENHFFSTALSPYGEETLKMGYWQALVKTFEHHISWFLRSNLHKVFPRFALGKIYGSTPVVEYRSTGTGCLALENFMQDYAGSLVPVAHQKIKEEILSPTERDIALKFKKEMGAQGTRIVLTSVPYGTDDKDHLEKWIQDPERRILVAKAEEPYEKIDRTAETLGLPLITVDTAGMVTFDGRHLDEASASRFTDLFFDKFLKNKEVQILLKAKQ